MKNKFKRIFGILTIVLFCFASFTSSVSAGVGSSIGPDSGGSTGGGGSSGGWGITSTNSTRIGWYSFPASTLSNVQLSSTLLLAGGAHPSLSVGPCMKGLYVAIAKPGDFQYMTWDWWISFYGSLCNPTKSPGDWGSSYSPWTDVGLPSGFLTDGDLIVEANKNGFYYNGDLETYTNGTTWLDAVWVTGWPATSSNTVVSITYVNMANADGSSSTFIDRKGDSAQSLYTDPSRNVPYNNKTLPGEKDHNANLTVWFTTVTKDSTYMTDGTNVWNVVDTYSKNGNSIETSAFNYNVNTPTVDQVYYTPFDLNRNGAALTAGLNVIYPGFSTSSGNLVMTVDNNQGITDGTSLKTLDTNTALEFNVKFGNGQFGIPTAAQGGFDIQASKPYDSFKLANGTYAQFVIEGTSGLKEFQNLGDFSQDSKNHQIVADKISNSFYWGTTLNATLSSTKASLTYNGNEHIGGNESISFPLNWNGGDFQFKTVTMGSYCLSNQGRPFWESQYQLGRFYTYGMSYAGNVTTANGISIAYITEKDLYAEMYTKIALQPVLRGDLMAYTVAGDLG